MKRIVRPLEIKSLDEKGVFKGYGSVFGNTDAYQDVVVKGAFSKDLQSKSASKIKMLWQHNTDQPIGVYQEVKEEDYGLSVVGQLLVDEVQQAKEAYALLKAGAIEGLSIGYSTNDSHIGADGKRYLTELKTWEISIVTFPANELAVINTVKSKEDIQTIRHFERFLRDAGFSKKTAKAIAADGYKAIDRRDADYDKDLIDSIKNLTQTIKQEV